MLEKPDLPDEAILSRVQASYGLRAARLAFLPLGADVNTAVYRLEAVDGTAYFLKLRRAGFAEITVALPDFLARRQGIRAVIPPLRALSGQLRAEFGEHRLVLYPFVEGVDGYQAALTDRQWVEYGQALKALHATVLPADLACQIPREKFPDDWRRQVHRYLRMAGELSFADPAAARLAAFLREKEAEIRRMVARADELAALLRESSPEFVLCHADIHPGNLHLGADGNLYIVDWDNPRFAPKELDLMFAGGVHSSPRQDTQEETLFYRGYGAAQVNRAVLAYYRYERVIVDVAEFGRQLLESAEGNENREQALIWCMSSFLPGRELEIAVKTDV